MRWRIDNKKWKQWHPQEGDTRKVWRFALWPTRIGSQKSEAVWLEDYHAVQRLTSVMVGFGVAYVWIFKYRVKC